MRDRVLVTGGTGKTGRRVVRLLIERGVPALVGSRSQAGGGADRVRFDWADLETFDAALDGVRAAYLVAPTDRTDHLPAMRPFLEAALDRGVERLVLLSASSLPEGGPMMGAVHAWLAGQAPGRRRAGPCCARAGSCRTSRRASTSPRSATRDASTPPPATGACRS